MRTQCHISHTLSVLAFVTLQTNEMQSQYSGLADEPQICKNARKQCV